MDATVERTTDLVIANQADLVGAYMDSAKIGSLITKIEAEARRHAPDTSTAKGRKAIASLAHKIARSKTALDGAGKDLNADMRKKIEIVDIERRRVRDRLDALKTEVRKPLDDWEKADEARKAGHRAAIEKLKHNHITSLSASAEINDAINAMRVVDVSPEVFDEFDGMAAEVKDAAIDRLSEALVVAMDREEQAEELARLREEKAARDAEEQRLAAERAEKERLDREEQARKDAKEKAELEKREAADRAARDAEARVKREADTREAELNQKLQDEKDRADKAAALERERIAKEQADAEAKEAQLRSDTDHRNKVHAEIVASIKAVSGLGLTSLVNAMIDGKIDHVKVEM